MLHPDARFARSALATSSASSNNRALAADDIAWVFAFFVSALELFISISNNDMNEKLSRVLLVLPTIFFQKRSRYLKRTQTEKNMCFLFFFVKTVPDTFFFF
jgi:hypothetical protein